MYSKTYTWSCICIRYNTSRLETLPCIFYCFNAVRTEQNVTILCFFNLFKRRLKLTDLMEWTKLKFVLGHENKILSWKQSLLPFNQFRPNNERFFTPRVPQGKSQNVWLPVKLLLVSHFLQQLTIFFKRRISTWGWNVVLTEKNGASDLKDQVEDSEDVAESKSHHRSLSWRQHKNKLRNPFTASSCLRLTFT